MEWKVHNTVAAIIEKNDNFLMVEERTKDGIKINQPAGHIEAGESLLEAVVRETLEETSYEFKPEYFIGVYKIHITKKNETFIRYTFSGSVASEPLNQTLDTVIIKTHWLSLPKILQQDNRRSILVEACLLDYIKGCRYPLNVVKELGTE